MIIRKISRILFWILFITIIIASITPHSAPSQSWSDNTLISSGYLYHFLAYFLLALSFSIYKIPCENRFCAYLFTAIFGIMVSVYLELFQIILPYRTFNFLDMLGNFLGFITGMFLTGEIIIKYLLDIPAPYNREKEKPTEQSQASIL